MEESYQEEAPQLESENQPEPKKKMSGWLIVLIVVLAIIVLCCAIACFGMLLVGPAVGSVFSTIVETMEVMTPVP